MKNIVVANAKGGCGKTLISTHLASYYAAQGKTVALHDYDRQCSALDWLAARPKKCPPIIGIKGTDKHGAEIQAAANDITSNSIAPQTGQAACEINIYDMPAGAYPEAWMRFLSAGDKLVIPVATSPTDLRAMWRYIREIFASGTLQQPFKVGLVASRTRPNTRYHQVVMDFLNKLSIPVIGSTQDSQNYVRASDRGLSIFDLPPSRVKQNRQQWQSIIEWLEQ